MKFPDKTVFEKSGWLAAIGLAAGFFLLGQAYLISAGNVILGLYSSMTALIVLYWLGHKSRPAIPLLNVLVIALALYIYHRVAYQSSVDWDMATGSVFPVLVGLLLVFTLHSPFRPAAGNDRLPGEETDRQRLRLLFIWILVIAAVVLTIVPLAKQYLAPFDYSNVINFFFVLRKDGILGDIPSAPFKAWGRLWVPAMYLVVLLASYRLILYRQATLGIWKSLLLIYLLGNVGGVIIATLSSNGLEGLALQVKSIHFNFYNTAKFYETFGEVWGMLGTFATHEIHRFHSFAMSHPPLHIVLNWVLIHVTGDSRLLIALCLGALAWTGVFPMFLIGRELFNREFGYYLAGLYATLPATLIINHVALDALIACLFAWALAFTLIGSRREGHGFMFLAGLAVGVFALVHYITPIILPPLFVVAVIGLRNQGKWEQGAWAWWKAALLKTALFLVGVGLPMLAVEIATQWKFDYPTMMQYIVFVAHKDNIPLHPWFVGSWLTWVNYFIYVGVGVTALFVLRWREILRGDWKNDIIPWVGITTMIVPFIMAVARQESERAFLLFNVFVVTIAALALWQGKRSLRYMLPPAERAAVPEMGGGWRPVFLFILALSFVNAVIIQMLAVDHF